MEVVFLKDFIDYQPAAVVSKEILRQKSGTITLFAFDKGQGLSEHTAPFDAFVYLLEGDAKVKISGKPFCVMAGEMIIMPADKPHSLTAESPFKMLLVMIKK